MIRATMVIMKGTLKEPYYTEVIAYKDTIHVGPEPFDDVDVGYTHDEILGTWSSWEQSTAMRISCGFKTRKACIDYTEDVASKVMAVLKASEKDPKHILARARKQFSAWCRDQIKSTAE